MLLASHEVLKGSFQWQLQLFRVPILDHLSLPIRTALRWTNPKSFSEVDNCPKRKEHALCQFCVFAQIE